MIHSPPAGDVSNRVHWTLRIGAAMCFLGHGVFGIIGKEAWVPYFAVVGIGEPTAWRLMPIIGAVDIVLAALILIRPRPVYAAYMIVWAAWTALLRPIAGEPFDEALERAGNYGVPFALIMLSATSGGIRWFGHLVPEPLDDERRRRVGRVLLWTVAALLAGHGWLALTGKPLLVDHWAALGVDGVLGARFAGMIDLTLAAVILLRPVPAVAVAIVAWKLFSESLFVVNGLPIWEVVERGGSYAAPLALAILGKRGVSSRE